MNNPLNIGSTEMLAAREASKNGIAIGALLAVLGVLAMMAPLISGIAVTVLIGILMIAAGIMQTFFAFKAETFGKGVLVFLFGGLGVLAGVIILMTPQTSLAFLTMLVAAFFVASGIIDIVLGFRKKPEEGWGWLAFSGALSVLLGLLIMAEWPFSGLWVIGFFVGLRMLVSGWVLMALGRAGQVALTQMQDARIESLEEHVREGAAMLAGVVQALANHTAALMMLDSELRQKVSSSEVDPAISKLNEGLGKARKSMQEVEAASEKTWSEIQKASYGLMGELQDSIAEVNEKLKASLDMAPKDQD